MAVNGPSASEADAGAAGEAPPVIRAENVSFSYPIIGRQAARARAAGASNGREENRPGGIGSPLRRLRRGRVEVEALRDVDLTVRRGDRVGILGRNGAGKSTLLRVIAGIYEPTAGSVSIQGRVTCLLNANLGMDAQLSGRENIRIRGMFLGLDRQEIEARLGEIIEFSELEEYIDLPLRVYSPGMRARLGFAVSTSFACDVLMLDEWLGAGDKEFVSKAKARMREFYETAGTVLLASHNEKLITDNCDSVVVMERGRVVERGAVDSTG